MNAERCCCLRVRKQLDTRSIFPRRKQKKRASETLFLENIRDIFSQQSRFGDEPLKNLIGLSSKRDCGTKSVNKKNTEHIRIWQEHDDSAGCRYRMPIWYAPGALTVAATGATPHTINTINIITPVLVGAFFSFIGSLERTRYYRHRYPISISNSTININT